MKKLLFPAAPMASRAADAALLLFRLHLGLSIAVGAGWAKLVQLTSATELSKLLAGHAITGAPDWFVQQVAALGFTFPSAYLWAYLWASLAIWGELIGGLLIALGLLTRLGAAQLAFQFFVIAFLWFEQPEPLLGMYYQQLLFWSFVLVSVVGGGRYSLDYWLAHREWPLAANARLLATAAAGGLLLLTSPSAQAQTQFPTVTMQELLPVARQWNGTLTYLDYSTKQPVSLPTSLGARQSAPRELTLQFVYTEPSGQQVTGADQLRLSADGATVEWDDVLLQVISKTPLPDHTAELVLEGRGQDDGKSCLIRKTLVLSATQFSVSKQVKYATSEEFVTRNTYSFHW
ncbi:DoxX family membrane protein [Hymenobacter sp. BT635]|uniref:DoxX family membrane protein n=1 Tax=Hymenobacter nitidus TaxID=2880929 RepID=A0ABS8AFA4_9BACT|nr:DoxX family membrane protein [Hymenobacter nitidus]MCB2379120.1 DoxX family membrane protein [Hymenobacter nitidus]